MEFIDNLIKQIDDIVWGVPLIAIIIICGITLTVKLRFIQIRKIGKGFKYMLHDDDTASGDVSSFAALCTSLAATVGTGNIVGVATAIATGGAGALFWMEIAALLGMATKYTEGLLAIKYRTKDSKGNILGGPFFYIENGMGQKWKWLGKIFAVFGVLVGLFGIGTFTQINGITSAVKNFFDPDMEHTVSLFGNEYSISVIIAGLVTTVLAALVLIGGLKSIAGVAQVIVPAMIITYVGCCLFILVTHITEIPAAFAEIFESAFGLRPIAGGAAGISVVLLSAQKGIARGIFSNEAGLGSAPIAASAAKTNEPVRQGLVSMMGTFIDTIIVCTMTGLVIIIGQSHMAGLQGVDVTTHAFTSGLPFPPKVTAFIIMACLTIFAFTTILGWNYYAERCLSYLIKPRKYTTVVFRWIYILAVFIGPYLTVEAVWNIADILNGLMALPNLTALFALSGVVKKETENYLKRTGD